MKAKKTKSPKKPKATTLSVPETTQPSLEPSRQATHAEQLLYEAEQEPDFQDLGEYFEVIDKLRDKGFSYGDIATWLSERGVEVDRQAVYRVYMKHLSQDEQIKESYRQQDEEDEERRRG